MKNAFYFVFKDLFVLEIFICLSIFFGYVKNGLRRKLWLISKFMTLQTEQQIITIHILPNISRSKGNQAMIFSEIIKYTMRNIFLQKSYTKCGGKTCPRPSYTAYLRINSLNCYKVCFYSMSNSTSNEIY